MARPHVVGVAAVSQCQVRIAIGTECNRSAVVVPRVLAERDDLAPRARIHHVGVRGADLPLVNDVLVGHHRTIGRDISRQCPRWNDLAVVGIERAVADAEWIEETRMECQPEKSTFVVGVGRIQRRRHPALDVERWSAKHAAVLNHPKQPILLHDEQTGQVARRADRVVRGRPGRDHQQLHGDGALLDVRERTDLLRRRERLRTKRQGRETDRASISPHHRGSPREHDARRERRGIPRR